MLYSREVEGTATASRGAVHEPTLKTRFDPSWTLYSNLMDRFSLDPEGSGRLFGWRPIDPQTGVVANTYEWVTLREFVDQAAACASGMKHLLHTERDALIGVFSKNRYEWCLVEHATSRMAYTLVPLYDTLGPNAVPFIMNHTEMKVVFCAKEQFKTLMGCIDQCPTVKTVVQFEDDVDKEEIELAKQHNVQLLTLTEVLAAGKENLVPADPPKPSDVCTVCYTSGTTGNPKGVMLTHANLMAAAGCSEEYTTLFPTDVHLSYLPLAHCFERNVQAHIIAKGGAIGFYQGDVTKLLEDMAVLQPTVFPSVPRLLNRIYDKLAQGIAGATGVKKQLIDRALAAKLHYIKADARNITHAFWDRLVFNKFKAALGGRVRLILSGSAPIAPEVKQFLAVAFCCPVFEGYGLTETGAVITCGRPDLPVSGHVGIPLAGNLVQLEDVPDMEYFSHPQTDEDKRSSDWRPRGEVLMKGDNLFVGYFKQPELTREVMDADGWFHTGDIGTWNADGTLSIIDRKKNIFKLSQGEYVAPEKVEAIYAKSPFVAQVYVHGDSLKNFLVAVIVPDADVAASWAKQQQQEGAQPEPEDDDSTDIERLCARKGESSLAHAIQHHLEAVGAENGLMGFERVRRIHLHPHEFTADNGLVTPTFKLKRHTLAKHFQKEIDAMYLEAESEAAARL